MPHPKTKKIIKYAAYGLVGLGVLSLLIYFFIIRPTQISNQKQYFAKAEASLDALTKQIEEKVGKPDQIKKEKSCDRANLKSSKGPLGCDVSILMQYDNKSAGAANELKQVISGMSSHQIRIGSGAAKGISFIDKTLQRGEQTFYQNFDLPFPLSCAFSFTYPAADHDQFATTTGENFRLVLGCGGPAMSEFYPLKD